MENSILLSIPREIFGDLKDSDFVIITGDFDNWEHKKYQLKKLDRESFYIEIPVIKNKDSIMFKFVLNNSIWLTIPYFKTAIAEDGFTNNILYYKEFQNGFTNNKELSEENLQKLEIIARESKVSKMDTNSTIADYVNVSSTSELGSTEILPNSESEFITEDLEQSLLLQECDLNACPNGTSVLGSVFDEQTNNHLGSLSGFITITKRLGNYWNDT